MSSRHTGRCALSSRQRGQTSSNLIQRKFYVHLQAAALSLGNWAAADALHSTNPSLAWHGTNINTDGQTTSCRSHTDTTLVAYTCHTSTNAVVAAQAERACLLPANDARRSSLRCCADACSCS